MAKAASGTIRLPLASPFVCLTKPSFAILTIVSVPQQVVAQATQALHLPLTCPLEALQQCKEITKKIKLGIYILDM